MIGAPEVVIIILMIVASGIFPFVFGAVAQLLLRQKPLSTAAAWLLGLGIVVASWLIGGKPPFRVFPMSQRIDWLLLSFAVSWIIYGRFIELGAAFVRWIRRHRKQRTALSSSLLHKVSF